MLCPCKAPQHPTPSFQQADAIARPRGIPARAKRAGLARPRRRGGPDERPGGLGRQPAGPGGRGPAGEREAAAGEREAAAGAGELHGESQPHPEGEPASAPVFACRSGMRDPSPAVSLGFEQRVRILGGATSASTQSFAHLHPSGRRGRGSVTSHPDVLRAAGLGWEWVPPPAPRCGFVCTARLCPLFWGRARAFASLPPGANSCWGNSPPFCVLISAPSLWWLLPANSCASVAGQLLVLTERGRGGEESPFCASGSTRAATESPLCGCAQGQGCSPPDRWTLGGTGRGWASAGGLRRSQVHARASEKTPSVPTKLKAGEKKRVFPPKHAVVGVPRCHSHGFSESRWQLRAGQEARAMFRQHLPFFSSFHKYLTPARHFLLPSWKRRSSASRRITKTS